MNPNPISRKRRPYCHDEASAEPVLQDVSRRSSAPTGHRSYTSSLSSKQHYILEHAAEFPIRIEVPLACILDIGHADNQRLIQERAALSLGEHSSFLLDLSHRRHQLRKRPRLNTDLPMPPYSDTPASQDGQEKSPSSTFSSGMPSALPSQGGDDNRRSFSVAPFADTPGWTSRRIADLFSNGCLCPPLTSTYDSQPGYQTLPTTATYDFDGTRPTIVDPTVSMQATTQSHGPGSFAATPVTEQRNFFACDDSALLAQVYPPMQATQVTGIQPTTSREDMVYPGNPSTTKYPDQAEQFPQAIGLGIQDNAQLMSPVDGQDAVSVVYANGSLSSPSFNRQADLIAFPPRYNPLPGYEEEGEPDSLDMNGRLVNNGMAIPHQRTPPARRGPFKDHDLREKTARTRKIGSCIRCKMQRIRCDLDEDDMNGPCLQCKKVANSKTIWRQPCHRWKIVDVSLFKPGQVKGHEWTQRWRDSVVDEIATWASQETRTIGVTEGFTDSSVQLRVRRFEPQEGDKLDRSWVSNGVKKSVQIPPFAIVDMEAAKAAIDEYIKKGLLNCCQKLLGSRLLCQTYYLAIKMMGAASTEDLQRSLLINTLDLWMSVRLTTKSFEIVGNETLGMPRDIISDQSNPLHGKIPLPPVMGAQIDSVLIHQVQSPLRRKVLDELQKMTQDRKQKTWLTQYLVTFILLHNLALITKHDADYARKHGMKTRFAREEKVKEYNLGANTLLAYFHYCNKGVLPFSDECKDQDLQTLAELDEAAIQFVHETRRYARNYMKEWEDLWENDDYENEYYYVSQLFEQNWQPRLMA